MKSAKRTQVVSHSVSLLALVFPLIPFVALIPNFYLAPDLSMNGLATQEYAFAWLITIVAVVALAQVIRQRERSLISRRDLLLLGALFSFWLWQLGSLFRAPDLFEGFRNTGLWLGFIILFSAGILGLREKHVAYLRPALDVFALVLAISQLYEFYRYREEMYGVFFSHGITSELLALLLPWQVTRYLTVKDRRVAVISLLLIGVMAAALLVNLRRGALGGVTVAMLGIVLALIFKWLKLASGRRIVLAVLLGLLIAAPVVYQKWETIVFRFQGATQLQASGELGLSSRLRVWATSFEMIRRHPLVGVGLGGYAAKYGDYRRYFVENPAYAKVAAVAEAEDYDEIHSPHSHNEYLEIIAELGFIGFILFVAFWALVIRRLWQNRKMPQGDVALGALFGLLAFGISSALSAFSFRFTPGVIIVACVLTAGFAVARQMNGKVSDPHDEPEPSRHFLPVSKAAVMVLVVGAISAGSGFIWRTGNVLSSQQSQSRTDFRFGLKPGENEIYLSRYQQALREDPYNAGAHLGLGLLLYQMKQLDDSIPHVEYALRHGYGRPFARVLQAFNYEQKGELVRAITILEECVANFPKSIFARAVLMDFLRTRGAMDRAREQENILRSQDENLAKSWGLALRLKNDAAKAEATRLGLPPPDALQPLLVRTLVLARAYHYLK